MNTIQYRALTEPISQAPEVEHVDAFWRQPSEPVREIPRSLAALAAAGSFFMVLGAPTVEPPEDIFPEKYWRPASEPVRRIPRPVSEGISILVLEPNQRPEEIFPDKWWRQPSEPVRQVPRPLDEGGYFSDLIGREEEPHPDAFVFKWEFPRRVLRVPLGDAAYPPYQEEAPVEEITLDKWFTLSEIPVLRRRTPPAGLTEPVSQDAEETLVTKWWQPASEPTRLRRRNPETGETPAILGWFVSDEQITVDKWFRLTDNPVLRRVKPHEWFTIAPNSDGEAITLDKWFRPASEPTRLRERNPETGETAPTLDALAAEIFLDWWLPASEPMRLRERPVDVGILAYLTEPTIYVLPNLEWWMPASEPVRFRALLRVGPMEWRSYDFLVAGHPGRIVFRDEAALIRFAESSATLQLMDTIGNTPLLSDDAAIVGMWDEAVELSMSDEVSG